MDRSLSVVGALAVWRSRARGRARAFVSMSSPARVAATTIEDVDAATLGKVLERLDDPADVVAFAASNRHLAAAADEPAWRAKFAASWDDPTFPVASYRELLLARHRALGAVSLGSAISPDATTPAPDFATLAAACDELARAVHASARVERTDATLRAARVLASLAAWLETLRRSPPSPSAAPTARRAVVSASRLVGAVAHLAALVEDAELGPPQMVRDQEDLGHRGPDAVEAPIQRVEGPHGAPARRHRRPRREADFGKVRHAPADVGRVALAALAALRVRVERLRVELKTAVAPRHHFLI